MKKTSSSLIVSNEIKGQIQPRPTQKQIINAMAHELVAENTRLNLENGPKRQMVMEKWEAEAAATLKRQRTTAPAKFNIHQPSQATVTIVPSQRMIDLQREFAKLAARPSDIWGCEYAIKNGIEAEMLSNLRAQLSTTNVVKDTLVALGLLPTP